MIHVCYETFTKSIKEKLLISLPDYKMHACIMDNKNYFSFSDNQTGFSLMDVCIKDDLKLNKNWVNIRLPFEINDSSIILRPVVDNKELINEINKMNDYLSVYHDIIIKKNYHRYSSEIYFRSYLVIEAEFNHISPKNPMYIFNNIKFDFDIKYNGSTNLTSLKSKEIYDSVDGFFEKVLIDTTLDTHNISASAKLKLYNMITI